MAGEGERRGGERESLRERERPFAPGGVRAGVGERPRDILRSRCGELILLSEGAVALAHCVDEVVRFARDKQKPCVT